jgi:putative cardiolipin synthase
VLTKATAGTKQFVRGQRTSLGGLLVALIGVLQGCALQPPGSQFPKKTSVALAAPESTAIGAEFNSAAALHEGNSGYRMLSAGIDGLVARIELANAAESTLDLQYFIYRGDETGRLVTDALLRAADRGVRIRLLIDDGATIRGDEQVIALDAHPNIEIRIFNPFSYRGHNVLLRSLEFLFNKKRLDYRMHNKLMVADNAVALIGGRNVGNQYFQIDPDSQYADDDLLAVGPIAGKLSATFDEFWNSSLAIPAAALYRRQRSATALEARRAQAAQYAERHLQTLKSDGMDYASRIAAGGPYADLRSGKAPLVWASATVVSDSPDKKNVESGARGGRLMARSVMKAALAAQSEVLMINPYVIPAKDEMEDLARLRARSVAIQILTNSLVSTTDLAAEAGYDRYRIPLLKEGVKIYELRALLGNTRGSGQSAVVSRYGNYSLHAKLIVFDRQELFIGSMNFDERSKRLNTEIGLLLDSQELAQQAMTRFERMIQPENAYALQWRDPVSGGKRQKGHIEWITVENGAAVTYTHEPRRSRWQRMEFLFLSCLPITGEL